MINETYHYLGAYIEIKVKLETKEHKEYICTKGHDYNHNHFEYCPECGELVKLEIKEQEQYPWNIYDLIPKELADNLTRITPYYLFRTDTIIAVGAVAKRLDGQWLWLDGYSSEKISEFPNPQSLVYDLTTGYATEIQALRDSDKVLSVTIKAGYVEDSEY